MCLEMSDQNDRGRGLLLFVFFLLFGCRHGVPRFDRLAKLDEESGLRDGQLILGIFSFRKVFYRLYR